MGKQYSSGTCLGIAIYTIILCFFAGLWIFAISLMPSNLTSSGLYIQATITMTTALFLIFVFFAGMLVGIMSE